jgi:hypothetical protein
VQHTVGRACVEELGDRLHVVLDDLAQQVLTVVLAGQLA